MAETTPETIYRLEGQPARFAGVAGEKVEVYVGRGEWVEYDDPSLYEIVSTPLFDNLHSDPRWLPFLESIGKSPEQLAAIEFDVALPE